MFTNNVLNNLVYKTGRFLNTVKFNGIFHCTLCSKLKQIPYLVTLSIEETFYLKNNSYWGEMD